MSVGPCRNSIRHAILATSMMTARQLASSRPQTVLMMCVAVATDAGPAGAMIAAVAAMIALNVLSAVPAPSVITHAMISAAAAAATATVAVVVVVAFAVITTMLRLPAVNAFLGHSVSATPSLQCLLPEQHQLPTVCGIIVQCSSSPESTTGKPGRNCRHYGGGHIPGSCCSRGRSFPAISGGGWKQRVHFVSSRSLGWESLSRSLVVTRHVQSSR
mmetsp:Transcript_13233/g.40086  ORF Transcript_13233/g.40086 Transcript_13233/m.40086 type:complete len:216 (+) Transcript_13233:1604-2251(+)